MNATRLRCAAVRARLALSCIAVLCVEAAQDRTEIDENEERARGPRNLRPRRGDAASRATRSAIAPHPHGLVPSLRESFLDERRRVEHERHALIAELGGAGESLHSRKRRAERLDDDVLLADDLI